MHGYRHPKSSRGLVRGDHYQEKDWITIITFKLLITGSYTHQQDEPVFSSFGILRPLFCPSQASIPGEVFAVALVALAPFSMMLKLQTKVIFDSR
jgi:hypothetical protein